jgi:hypothetical protein
MSSILLWVNIWIAYGTAIILMGGGAYLRLVVGASPLGQPFRIAGYLLFFIGFGLALHTHGEQIGGESCEAAWKKANYQAQIDRAKQEADVQKTAAATAQAQAIDLQATNDDLQKQADIYAESLADAEKRATAKQGESNGKTMPSATAVACDLSAADVRSLRAIAGADAAQGQHSKRLRAKRQSGPGT